MKRILLFSSVFFLLLGLFFSNPKIALANTLPDGALDAAYIKSDSNDFLISYSDHYSSYFLLLNPSTVIEGETKVYGSNVYQWSNSEGWRSNVAFPKYTNLYQILFSTVDITSEDGSIVFFSVPIPPIPKALKTLLPALMGQSMKILPVAIVIMAAMMGVSLISRVLYRYL